MSADAAADRRPQSWSTGEREWTPGFSDWLGDCFLDFDLTTATSLERLQFKREFSDSPVFETALKERVAELQHLQHPSLETVRGVTRVPGKGLILESKHTAGRRLSEVFPQEPGSTMAVDLIRQLVPMLALLHKTGPGVAHGAISAERIVVTRDGRLVLTEHVLGGALAAQQMPTMRWRALGLPIDGEMAIADERGDLIQLGFLALSIMLGRRLSAIDYPGNIERFVSESAMSVSGRSPETAWLRRWIERALQVGPSPFTSAQEAREALTDLSDAGSVPSERSNRPTPAPTPAPSPAPTPAPVPAPPLSFAPPPVTPVIPMPRPAEKPAEVRAEARPKSPTFVAPPAPPATPPAMFPQVAQAVTPMAQPITPSPAPVAAQEKTPPRAAASAKAPASRGPMPWLAGLAVLAVAEAVVIVALMMSRPASIVADAGVAPTKQTEPAPSPTNPPSLPHLTATDTATTPATKPAPTQSTPAPEPPAAERPAVPAERFGGIRVSSAVALQVFEGTTLLGSTQGPIAMLEGAHNIDLVNEALEFRMKKTTVVKPGQMTPLTIQLPNGRLSINALPWADVLIDGKPAGQTPLANLTVTIGEHEIIFRNPQFPEQKQTTVVKAETPTRVSVTFSK
jgi:hypothetical protein